MGSTSSFGELILQLYAVVRQLEEMTGRPFTPDGHMVGSIGEWLVADSYDLRLMPPSTEGFDAISPGGKRVEIKATQRDRVAFRSQPEHCIAIRVSIDGSFQEVYNGPGELIWDVFKDKPVPKNGQYQISLTKLRSLQDRVREDLRIKQSGSREQLARTPGLYPGISSSTRSTEIGDHSS